MKKQLILKFLTSLALLSPFVFLDLVIAENVSGFGNLTVIKSSSDRGGGETFFDSGYRTCTCTKTCNDGADVYSCGITSDDAQCGSVGGDGDKGCYCGAVGDDEIEYVTCRNGSLSKTLKNDLQKGKHPKKGDIK